MAFKYRIYQVTTILLAFMFSGAGFFKLFPHLIREPNFPQEFRRYVAIPPLNTINLDPELYRIAVAVTELVCAAILIISNHGLQRMANYIIVVIMMGALYTHYMVNDPPEKMGGAAVGLVLALLRLYSISYSYTEFKIKIG